jgi:hypothetical protein
VQVLDAVGLHVHAMDLPVGRSDDPGKVMADEAIDAEDEDFSWAGGVACRIVRAGFAHAALGNEMQSASGVKIQSKARAVQRNQGRHDGTSAKSSAGS